MLTLVFMVIFREAAMPKAAIAILFYAMFACVGSWFLEPHMGD
jgi:hypothetical protein